MVFKSLFIIFNWAK